MNAELLYAANNSNLTDRCNHGADRMKMTDINSMWHKKWNTIMLCLVLMFCVIVMPSVTIVLHGLIQPGELSKVDQEQKTIIDKLQDELCQVKKRLDRAGISEANKA
eukprot:CAMPEP_0176249980 /NCGR_PEP_ID=MMETSP0121_2-20121125/34250_1 /TAXON_ID=160619 /ORGANISM="Kryptoperidinium foliaceum, Strain CCMP 1326" /LENGTH=106 /DNA_ID=CAMNT_0017589683 /DNA_START=27 /DNA_END=347 /DNA_ORIENTATION=+